ncbi:dynein regulatory complex subunit 2 isoform X3 [Cherax quadricarinatus]|uniref:dynein regulatory complex subunit 2 isoform X3 n=1 Tax=Cherax quadricarinatus TaxID=27406 RepID=UPI002377E10A|nr:dynein regulatory complex subunit 2-like isoform X3 [Cherax quadricarinatus]
MAPKKKGKGKGDKLSRMTVEQRQQYLDRRAAQEAETNRRKEELLACFLKLKLADEERKGNVNQAKLMTKWREVLRQSKTSTLTTQLKELKTRVAETTKQQERLIHLLSSQVNQAQYQRTRAAHNHLSAVHKLTELHEEHVEVLNRHMRADEAQVVGSQAAGTEDMAATHLHNLRRLSLVSQASHRHHNFTEREELAAFHTTTTHLTTQLEEEVAAARVEREAALEEAWARLALSLRDHQQHTASLRDTCNHLQQRVSNNHTNLTSINNAIMDMQSEVEEVRKQLRQVERPSAAAQELQQLKKTVMVLRASLASHCIAHRTLIKAINRRGYKAKMISGSCPTHHCFLQQLEETLKVGRAVLEMVTACDRLEMHQDRNIPFLPPPPPPILAAATAAVGCLRTRLAAPVPPPSHTLISLSQPQELETQVGLSTETDEGLGVSLPSSQEPAVPTRVTPRAPTSVVETDEGVGSSIGLSVVPVSTITHGKVTLPRLPSPLTPNTRGVIVRRAMLGQDKLARIGELLYHEEAAHEAAHTLQSHPTSDPLPDFVLQEESVSASGKHQPQSRWWQLPFSSWLLEMARPAGTRQSSACTRGQTAATLC